MINNVDEDDDDVCIAANAFVLTLDLDAYVRSTFHVESKQNIISSQTVPGAYTTFNRILKCDGSFSGVSAVWPRICFWENERNRHHRMDHWR